MRRLLLTSAGITKRKLAEALIKLVKKPSIEIKVGFIPVAANVEGGNKDWFINQFLNFWRYGFDWIDVVDPSAEGVDDWKQRLAAVDVIFMSGGNTFHLLDQVRKTGLDKWLAKNLKDKVYVGSSAGSILATPTIELAGLPYGDANLVGLKDLTGLKLTDFEIAPHYEENISDQIKRYAQSRPNPVYAIDDQTAIQVVGGKIEVVSEGFWKLYD